MRKALNVLIILIPLVFIVGLYYFTLAPTKSSDLMFGLSDSISAYMYFAMIWFSHFATETVIVNLKNNNKFFVKTDNSVYYAIALFIVSVISFIPQWGLKTNFFIFFTLLPSVFYGIKNGLKESNNINTEANGK